MVKEYVNRFAELDAKNVMFLMDVLPQMMENVSTLVEDSQIVVEVVRSALLLGVVNVKNAKQITS
jgi:uncharacterized protein (DUF58 family)